MIDGDKPHMNYPVVNGGSSAPCKKWGASWSFEWSFPTNMIVKYHIDFTWFGVLKHEVHICLGLEPSNLYTCLGLEPSNRTQHRGVIMNYLLGQLSVLECWTVKDRSLKFDIVLGVLQTQMSWAKATRIHLDGCSTKSNYYLLILNSPLYIYSHIHSVILVWLSINMTPSGNFEASSRLIFVSVVWNHPDDPSLITYLFTYDYWWITLW
jgi:hypothetical protein